MFQKRPYLSHLLRLWRESQSLNDGRGHPPLWRASLEGPQSEERLVFLRACMTSTPCWTGRPGRSRQKRRARVTEAIQLSL